MNRDMSFKCDFDRAKLNIFTTATSRTIGRVDMHRLSLEEFQRYLPVFDETRFVRYSDSTDETGFVTGKIHLGDDFTITLFGPHVESKDKAEAILNPEATHA